MTKLAIPAPILDLWSWQNRSACRDMDTELFFAGDVARGAPKRAYEAAAKTVCATCPVISQCLAWALSVNEPHGIWGGLNPEEREVRQDSADESPIRATERREVRAVQRCSRP